MKGNQIVLTFFTLLIAVLPLSAQNVTQWVLEQSTLSYHMSHPMHEVDGVSHAAKGKGTCQSGHCDFLVAAPVRPSIPATRIAIST